MESDLKEAIATKAQLEQELVDHRKDRAAAKDSIATATAIREKEHKEYSKEAAEVSANVNALSQAIPAIEKGMAGSFLQTPTAGALRKLLATAELSGVTDFDRRMVLFSELHQFFSETNNPYHFLCQPLFEL